MCRSITLLRKIIHGTNVAQSPIQTKKQGNKKSSGGGGWTWRGKGGCIKWGGGVGNIGGYSENRGVGTPCQL